LKKGFKCGVGQGGAKFLIVFFDNGPIQGFQGVKLAVRITPGDEPSLETSESNLKKPFMAQLVKAVQNS
jgi:hypothetical protein